MSAFLDALATNDEGKTIVHTEEYVVKCLLPKGESFSTFWVSLFTDEGIVGSASFNLSFGCQDYWIHSVEIYKAFRGRGFGKALMQALIEEAKQCGYPFVVLDVYKDNDIAQKLYKKLGFKIIKDCAKLGTYIMRLDLVQQAELAQAA